MGLFLFTNYFDVKLVILTSLFLEPSVSIRLETARVNTDLLGLYLVKFLVETFGFQRLESFDPEVFSF